MTTTAHQRTLAIAAVAAPVLLLLSTVAYVANGDGLNDGEAGGAIQVWAMIAYAVTVVGLCRLFEGERPGAAAGLTVLGLAGAAAGVGYGIDSIQAALVGGESIQEMDSAAASLALQVPGILFPLSIIAIGVMLLRTAAVPRWTALGLIVGAVLFPASRIPAVEALAIASDVVLLLALAPLGLQMLRPEGRAIAGTA